MAKTARPAYRRGMAKMDPDPTKRDGATLRLVLGDQLSDGLAGLTDLDAA